MRAFGQRLHAATSTRGPLCAGIDPHPSLLRQWDLPDTVDGLERFALAAAGALAPVTAVVKPQSAFFERFGSAGIGVLERTVQACRSSGALVLLDVKRGDIGSTARGYAEAYLEPSAPMAVDAITASPYLGFGSLGPLLEVARDHGTGVFVLALTSNPEGPEVQHARTASGATVAATVLAGLRQANAGADPLGSFGAVVGATIGDSEEDLDVNGPLLAPGLGAQGATVHDVRRVFAGVLDRVLPTASRSLLAAGPDPDRLRAAAERTAEEMSATLGP